MTKKIIKNLSGSTKQILNRDILNNGSYDIDPQFWESLSLDISIHTLINSGDYIVNNGDIDFSVMAGLEHVKNINGIIRDHSDITLLPAVTVNAPEVVKISDSSIAFCMEIDNEVFGQSRLNNYAGGSVEVQLHMAIDNNITDRWIQFDISYITTDGSLDRQMDSVDGVLQMGPVEVPSTPWLIFESVVEIPESAFLNGEKYIYIGVKRTTATGKISPTSHPAILRYCKRYWKNTEE